jgi:hypothetical protein
VLGCCSGTHSCRVVQESVSLCGGVVGCRVGQESDHCVGVLWVAGLLGRVYHCVAML